MNAPRRRGADRPARRRNAALACLAAAVLASCSKAPPPPDPAIAQAAREAAETRAFVEAARRQVQANLRDPESARFRKASIATATLESGRTVRVACGYVNARNGFGGYAGDAPWLLFEFWDKSTGVCIEVKGCPHLLVFDDVAKACLADLGG